MTFELFARHLENIDQDLHVFEDVLSLTLEELLHEHVLTTAIPEGKNEVSKESDARLGYVDSEGDSVSVTSKVVRENDRSHGGLSCSNLSHEEDFLDLWLSFNLSCLAICDLA